MTSSNIIATAVGEDRTTLTEPESKRVLAEWGIDVPPFEVVASADAASRAARNVGPPVAVKVVSPDIAHKSEWAEGLGVQTGIDTPDGATAAARSIFEAAAELEVEVSVLIEASVDLSQGTEIIVGGSRDPSFGPTVLIGHGGTYAEVYEDTAHRLAPLSSATALDAISRLRAATFLDGYRNLPPADEGALAEVLTVIGDIVETHDEISEIDVNPVLASASGAMALDAHIVLHDSTLDSVA